MIIAVILSGGIGTRMGANVPKQYIEVNGKPIIRYTLECFINSGQIDALIIALNNTWEEYVKQHIPSTNLPIYFSHAGETREHTIYNALKTAKDVGYQSEDIVIIHDAVRPLVSKQVIQDCLNGCIDNDASIATIDVKDTIYMSSDNSGCITNVPNRSFLHAGQTPEAFKLGKYLQIHDNSTYEEISSVTGGAQFAFQKGLKVFLSKGEEINFKITTPVDLERFKLIVNP